MGSCVITSSSNPSAEQWKIPWTTMIPSRYKGLQQPWGLQTQSWWQSSVQKLTELLIRNSWRFPTTTLFHLILAAWETSLYRHTQQNTFKWKPRSFQIHFAELNKSGILVWSPTLSTPMKTKLFHPFSEVLRISTLVQWTIAINNTSNSQS